MTDPWTQFAGWFAEAQDHEPDVPDAFALATVAIDNDGTAHPDVRMVLLKAFDARGFVFYTDKRSAKGRQLAATPQAALDFHWKTLRRQVRAQGTIAPISEAESDAYFATRPRASQLSAWASQQSSVMESRQIYEARLQEMAARFPDAVPRPAYWGGLRLVPDWVEFWEDRRGRQHVRQRFIRDGSNWHPVLLYP